MTTSTARYQKLSLASVPPVPCPCGHSRRAFVEESDGVASMHMVDISQDSQVHYHRNMTEIYYILEGEGVMELDGESLPVRPGDAILIKPDCRHRAVGRLRLINVAVPAFDPLDEHFD
jgi:mannose-6-phosphate isomerase-like protein (cupin superfamily)